MTRRSLFINLIGKVLCVLFWHSSHRAAAVVCFVVPDFVVLYHLFRPSAQGLGQVITRFQTDRREVWLTIDDGPDEHDTPQILDLLDRHGAKATFFVVGERASRRPDLVAEIVRRGHEVAHHTQTHPAGTFWCASPFRLARELDEGLKTLAEAGVRPRWFRPPVGIKNLFLRSALRQRNLVAVGWSVRGIEKLGGDPKRVRDRILRKVQPGAIILLHEGKSVPAPIRVRAIAEVLAALADRGFACVLPELNPAQRDASSKGLARRSVRGLARPFIHSS